MHGNQVERIDLGDGQWWEIYTVCTRGMRKVFRKAGLRGFASGLRDGVDIDLADPAAMRKLIMAHPEAWDMDAIDDAFLLSGTHAYSFGEINLETIDDLDNNIVARVLARMQELYKEIGEEARKNS